MTKALQTARKLADLGYNSLLMGLVLLVDDFINNDSEQILSDVEGFGSHIPALDRLAYAWAVLDTGYADQAFTAFKNYEESDDFAPLMKFNLMLAKAANGDIKGAIETYSQDEELPNEMELEFRYIFGQLFSHLGEVEKAINVIGPVTDIEQEIRLILLSDLKFRILSGETVKFDYVNSPQQGMAQLLNLFSQYLALEGNIELALNFSRLANFLNPGNDSISVFLAAILMDTGNNQFANEILSKINNNDVLGTMATIARSDALYALDRPEEAIALLLDQLNHDPNSVTLNHQIGNMHLKRKQFNAALVNFSNALEILNGRTDVGWIWTISFYRAIAYEKLGNWPSAEADFRNALKLSNNSHFMLNYLGYTLADRGEKLEEAEGMIRAAVEVDPNNPYYLDSLAWVLYKQNRFSEAVGLMEKAVRYLPKEAILIDHLGDIYWQIGRFDDARNSWKESLGYESDEIDPERVKRKLEIGLDQMLIEENQLYLNET